MKHSRFRQRLPGRAPATVLVMAALFSWMVLVSPALSHALSSQEIFRLAEEKVLVLEVLDEKGKQVSAHTALLLDRERAVTQCDLLTDAAGLMLRQGSRAYPVKPMQKDLARNLCLLKLSDSSAGLRLRDADPEVGARVYAVSNALGLGISISEGVVSGIREVNGDTVIQFTAPIAPGSEGGGLFDEEGRLVGVINYRQRDGQNVNFALPARWLRLIEQRAASTDAAESWRVKASQLAKESKWRELAELATQWSEALPDSLEALNCLRYARENLKEWPAVEKTCRELFKRDPASSSAGVGLAAALIIQGKHQEALEAARATLAYRREDATVWVMISFAEEALGHGDEAKSAMEKAVQLEPWNRAAQQGMVALGKRRKEWGPAIAAQSRIVEFDPGNVAERLELVDLLLSGGRPQRALAAAGRAVDLAPDNGDAWIARGMALMDLRRFREASEVLQKGLELKPARPALGWFLLGEIYLNLRLFPEAIRAYREALRLAPQDTRIREALGIALKDDLQLKDALALFEKLREENPKDPLPWRQIGYVHGYLAQADQAIPAYEQSLSLDPRQPKVWAALMEAYQAAGRMDDAKRSWQKLQALNQEWADYAFKRVLLPYEVTP